MFHVTDWMSPFDRVVCGKCLQLPFSKLKHFFMRKNMVIVIPEFSIE